MCAVGFPYILMLRHQQSTVASRPTTSRFMVALNYYNGSLKSKFSDLRIWIAMSDLSRVAPIAILNNTWWSINLLLIF
jgi:hypothetical protein